MSRMLRPSPKGQERVGARRLTERMEDSTSSARRTPVLTREVYVWIYVTALAVVGALGWALFTHDGNPHAEPQSPVVGGGARVRLRRDLRRPRQLPPQRPLLLARRRAVRVRARVRHGRRLRARRAHRHRDRLGPDPPAGARQALLQPRAAGDRDQRRGRGPASRRRRRRRAAARHLDRPVRGEPRQWRADDRPARRRDRARRGQPQTADARPDVRDRRAGHLDQREHRDRGRARGRHRPARRAGAARAGADRLRRLSRLHLRAPAPRAARVPLRRQPHALPLTGGGRGPRGAARQLAGSLQRRRRRGAAVHRRRRPAAHDPRPGRPARVDGARRPRRRRGALRPGRRREPGPLAHSALRLSRTCARTCSSAASATR